eukprot:Nk52_evm22s1763 gene=Nk52_evmTU22s1763
MYPLRASATVLKIDIEGAEHATFKEYFVEPTLENPEVAASFNGCSWKEAIFIDTFIYYISKLHLSGRTGRVGIAGAIGMDHYLWRILAFTSGNSIIVAFTLASVNIQIASDNTGVSIFAEVPGLNRALVSSVSSIANTFGTIVRSVVVAHRTDVFLAFGSSRATLITHAGSIAVAIFIGVAKAGTGAVALGTVVPADDLAVSTSSWNGQSVLLTETEGGIGSNRVAQDSNERQGKDEFRVHD